MPVNTSGIVPATQPGAELTCKGHNFDLPPGDASQRRGVLSYYATAALPAAARSVADWLARTEAHIRQDVDAGHLPPLYRPQLQLLGDGEKLVF